MFQVWKNKLLILRKNAGFIVKHSFTSVPEIWPHRVVTVPPHAVRAYIASRDIALYMVCQSLPILHLATWMGLKEENQKQRRENQRNLRLRPQST